MMTRFFLVRGSEARSTQTTSSRTWTTGQLGGRTGTLCSIWTEVTVLILAFFFSDFVKSGYYNDADKVQIGQIILWTRQSLSTATLMSSTSSRCTTPLLTSGGDSFERSFLNLFHQQVPPWGLVQSGAHSRGIRCWPGPGFNFDIMLVWKIHFL